MAAPFSGLICCATRISESCRSRLSAGGLRIIHLTSHPIETRAGLGAFCPVD